MSTFVKAKNMAKQLVTKTLQLPFRADSELTANDVTEARSYIANYWQKVERFHPKDDESLLGLPKPYLVPSYKEKTGFDYNELYYWDSYFMVQGMLDDDHKELVIGILENLLSLFKRFKVIPNASRTYLTGRSQPPFLTTFIFDVYQTYGMSDQWLKDAIDVAKQEYQVVWMGVKKPNERNVYRGLSRYYDINYLHDLAEAESGWDMTPRFERKCLDYLPIDLNSLLYQYESDFARLATLTGNSATQKQWLDKAQVRKSAIDELMWGKLRGFYFDYNYQRQELGNVWSLAGYYPMWVGLASPA